VEDFVYDVLNEDRWWWSVGRRALAIKLWKRYGKGRREAMILDIGCGAGSTLKELGKKGRGYGMDVSPRAVGYCLERGIDSVCLGDASRLPYGDGLFDLITSIDVLEHVKDDVDAMREMRRVAKPGAVIIFTVPAFQFLWSRRDDQCHHVRRYSLAEVKEKTRAAGLQSLRSTYINLPLLVPLLLLVKVGHLLRRNPSRGMDYVLVPPLINRVLGWVVRAEARWLSRLDLPLGTSVACVAVKPDSVPEASRELTSEHVGG
jgi:SAM-dependent methyltransferase